MINDYRDKYLNIGDLELHYLEWGTETNPTVILLHGLRGHAHSWDEVSSALKDNFHVIALDQRGRGSSDWSPNQDYSIEAYSDDLLKFSELLGLDTFILVGHSMGGRNAMYFAIQHTEKLTKLGIIDIGPKIDSIGSERIGNEMANGPTEFKSIQDIVDHLRKSSPYASDDESSFTQPSLAVSSSQVPKQPSNGAPPERTTPSPSEILHDTSLIQDPPPHVTATSLPPM